MDQSILTLFSNFGYPALVSGVLLYIIVNKLEKISTQLESIREQLIKLDTKADVREAAERKERH